MWANEAELEQLLPVTGVLSDAGPPVVETCCLSPLFREQSPKFLHPRLCEKSSSLCPRERLLLLVFFKAHLKKKQYYSVFLSTPPTWPQRVNVPFRQLENS